MTQNLSRKCSNNCNNSVIAQHHLCTFQAFLSFISCYACNNIRELPYNWNIWQRKYLANRQNLPIGENLNWWLRLWVNHVSCNMATHKANSCIRGFHVYSDIWTLFVGETLACEQESGNPNDPYA